MKSIKQLELLRKLKEVRNDNLLSASEKASITSSLWSIYMLSKG